MGGASGPREARISGLRRIAPALAGLALIAAAPAAANASAWNFKKGEGQLILTQYDYADRSFDPDGDAVYPVDFEKHELSLFGEYGLTDTLTAVTRLALQDVYLEIESGRDAARGLAASEVGLRHALWWNDQTVVSTQATVILPGAGENVTDIFFGEGQTDYEARLLAGHSFKWRGRDGFIDAQAGYRWRGGDFGNEQRLDLTLGYKVTDRLTAMGQSFFLASDKSKGLNRDYMSARGQLSAVYWLTDRRAVQLGGLATLAGENIIRERAIFAAYWIRF